MGLRQFWFLTLQWANQNFQMHVHQSKFSFTLTEKKILQFCYDINPRKNMFVKFCYFQPYLSWPYMHLLQDCLKNMRLLWSCYIRLWSTAAIQAWTTVGISCIATISQSLVLVKMSFKVWSIWSGIITCCFENHSCVKDWKTMQNRVYKTAKWAAANMNLQQQI